MLSKKMTVSLMSLITILALAFVVPGALAQDEFAVTVETHNTDYRYAAADTAIQIQIMLTTGLPVTDTAALAGLTLTPYTATGSSATAPTLTLVGAHNNTTTKRLYQFEVTPGSGAGAIASVVLDLGALTTSDLRVTAEKNANVSKAKKNALTFTFTAEAAGTIPKVISIQRLRPGSQTVVAAFQEERIDLSVFPTFDVRIVLSAAHTFDPANAGNLVEVEQGTASGLVVGAPFAWQGARGDGTPALPVANRAIKPHPSEGEYYFDNTYPPLQGRERRSTQTADTVPMPTATDDMYRQYRVTITPFEKSGNFDVKIRVKSFHDGGSPIRNTYIPPGFGASSVLPNGRDILTIPVKGAARDLTAGYKVRLKKDIVIPAGGYLVIAKNKDGSKVEYGPGPAGDWRINDTPRATHRTPEQLKYNVIDEGNLKDALPNLATQFLTGVVLDVQSQHAGLIVSEVMWGEDVSLVDRTYSQYIELYNLGAQYKTIDDKDETKDINEALTLIFYAPNEFNSVPPEGADGSLPAGITDRIGTLYGQGSYWNPSTKGQSGSSGVPLQNADDVEVTIARTAVTPIVSMYRVLDATGHSDGQKEAGWMSSQGPKSANFKPVAIGARHGTPGAATTSVRTQADIDADKQADEDMARAAATATADDIRVTEIMVDTDNGRLPQWIELTHVGMGEVNLDGWEMVIDNAIDDKVLGGGAALTLDLSGAMLDVSKHIGNTGKGQSLLVVAWAGRHSGNIRAERVLNVATQLNQTRRYQLLSYDGFRITLVPPQTGAIGAFGDVAGNLDEEWELAMDESGIRSSLIRVNDMEMMGTDEGGWLLASSTNLVIGQPSYYGSDEDAGTPGHALAGPLPVELSSFRPARDKTTGAVVITWSTQSELNNAGFFIKRAQQRDGQFQVINATMIPGKGTTSEKQFYTYTDTTAQPNVVYYYQIEDVSLDGQRQTLTRGIRLKGHIGAAGKLTSLWGELKSSNE